MAVRIQFRRGTSTQWTAANPVLADGELGYESDTKVIKFGNGTSTWSALPVAAAGDITAVIAGTGLTGGATSGQATLAIDSSYVVTANAIDAKGDMIVGAGPDTYTKLPVGADGSVLVADSTQSVGVRWAAASSSSGAVLPTGTILPFAGSSLPAGGFLWCDGAAQSRSTYSALFTAIGVSYGAGNGSSTFNVPDLRAKVPAGQKSADQDFGVLGVTVGEARNTLTSSQVPNHDHSITFTPGGGVHPHTSATTSNESATHSHSLVIQQEGNHTHGLRWFANTGSGTNIFGLGMLGVNSNGDTTNTTLAGSSHGHEHNMGNQSANHTHTVNITNSGDHSHSATIVSTLSQSVSLLNIQPSLVVNYIIKT